MDDLRQDIVRSGKSGSRKPASKPEPKAGVKNPGSHPDKKPGMLTQRSSTDSKRTKDDRAKTTHGQLGQPPRSRDEFKAGTGTRHPNRRFPRQYQPGDADHIDKRFIRNPKANQIPDNLKDNRPPGTVGNPMVGDTKDKKVDSGALPTNPTRRRNRRHRK